MYLWVPFRETKGQHFSQYIGEWLKRTIELISASDSTIVRKQKKEPTKTQTMPAVPPLVNPAAVALQSRELLKR